MKIVRADFEKFAFKKWSDYTCLGLYGLHKTHYDVVIVYDRLCATSLMVLWQRYRANTGLSPKLHWMANTHLSFDFDRVWCVRSRPFVDIFAATRIESGSHRRVTVSYWRLGLYVGRSYLSRRTDCRPTHGVSPKGWRDDWAHGVKPLKPLAPVSTNI